MASVNPEQVELVLSKICRPAGGPRSERETELWQYASETLENYNDLRPLTRLGLFKSLPVAIDEFIDSPEFLGNIASIWPKLRADLRVINPDILMGESPVHEVCLGGATGTGKSTIARTTILYQVYFLSCLRDLQRTFGLEPGTKFVFPLQSAQFHITQNVLYQPLREVYEKIPYVQKHHTWNRQLRRYLDIDGGIQILPMRGQSIPLLGQAVFGGVMDEVNFMDITERSTRTAGPRGQGGHYDQAEELYGELISRRKSRFPNPAIPIGCIILSSSARYPHDFLARRITDAEATQQRHTAIFTHKRYDVAPPNRYNGQTIQVIVGDDEFSTRALGPGEIPPAGAAIEDVPIEHRDEFIRDPERALRDIVGIATDTFRPFIQDKGSVSRAVALAEEIGLEPWLGVTEIDLSLHTLPPWVIDRDSVDLTKSRFIHLDLSLSRDACGVAIIHLHDYSIETVNGEPVQMPRYAIDAAVAIKPSPSHEINYEDLRSWLLELVAISGVTIHCLSTDGYQATDMRQILQNKGVRTQEISVDRDAGPYELLRGCLNEGRVAMTENLLLQKELLSLERVGDLGKIDHPPRGSKDVADAVCGAIYSAQKSRTIRTMTGRSGPIKRREGIRR
ncbi:MAG: hypothetical protein HOC63_15985 [Rhodospirillales bacterium]|jgi:hypothetical protein|nr:hypothetical protein [Rhodospirillales bacterium]MBT4039004.1 hypothetical protein [Rhodospirillales bacterium]MBT4628174.1 hypothetical protein [Rhodospirillales bacterium]MBT5353452.1 hypothetical protein [Rhodospirillales bacterium]MBT5522152.1 hypothetical protein [Rhodospirillales bacterium]